MVTMAEKSEILQYINALNEANPHMKFFPEFKEEILLGVDIRFFTSRGELISEETEEYVADMIAMLSSSRIFMAHDGLFKYGIMNLKTSFIHRRYNISDIKRVLNYISKDMRNELYMRQ